MKRIILWLDQYFEESIMLTLLSVMLILMGLQVFMRYAVARSLSWPEEIIRYSFIWFVFIGISYSVKHNIHLKVDLLEMAIPRFKGVLLFLQDIVFFAFCVFMIRPALSGVGMLLRSGQSSAALGVPMWLVYTSLLLGFALTIFRFIQKWWRRLRARYSSGTGQEASA